MSWHAVGRRLLRMLPGSDRERLEPEVSAVLEEVEAHRGVGSRDAGSVAALVLNRWTVAALGDFSTVFCVLVAAFVAAVMMYLGVVSYQLTRWVDASLPCEPSLLTDTRPHIDPLGYHLFTTEEVAASRALDECSVAGRSTLDADGLNGKASIMYTPALVVYNFVGTAAVLAMVLRAGLRRRRQMSRRTVNFLMVPVVLVIAALVLQWNYSETIQVMTILTD